MLLRLSPLNGSNGLLCCLVGNAYYLIVDSAVELLRLHIRDDIYLLLILDSPIQLLHLLIHGAIQYRKELFLRGKHTLEESEGQKLQLLAIVLLLRLFLLLH